MGKIGNGSSVHRGRNTRNAKVTTSLVVYDREYVSDASLFDSDSSGDEYFETSWGSFQYKNHEVEVQKKESGFASAGDEGPLLETVCEGKGKGTVVDGGVQKFISVLSGSREKGESSLEVPCQVHSSLVGRNESEEEEHFHVSTVGAGKAGSRITRGRLVKHSKKSSHGRTMASEQKGMSRKTGKRTAASQIRSSWGILGIERMKESSTSLAQDQTADIREQDDDVRARRPVKGRKRGEKSSTGRKRTLGRKNSFGDVGGGTGDHGTNLSVERTSIGGCVAEVEEGASGTGPIIGGTFNFDCTSVQTGKGEEPVRSVDAGNKHGASRRSSWSISNKNRHIKTDMMVGGQQRTSKTKRGRPKKLSAPKVNLSLDGGLTEPQVGKMKVEEASLGISKKPGSREEDIKERTPFITDRAIHCGPCGIVVAETMSSDQSQHMATARQELNQNGTNQSIYMGKVDGCLEQGLHDSLVGAENVLSEVLDTGTTSGVLATEKVLQRRTVENKNSTTGEIEQMLPIETGSQEGTDSIELLTRDGDGKGFRGRGKSQTPGVPANQELGSKRKIYKGRQRMIAQTKIGKDLLPMEGHAGLPASEFHSQILKDEGAVKDTITGETPLVQPSIGKRWSTKQGESSVGCEDVGSATSRGSALGTAGQGELGTVGQLPSDVRSLKKGRAKDSIELSMSKMESMQEPWEMSDFGDSGKGSKSGKGRFKQFPQEGQFNQVKQIDAVKQIGKVKITDTAQAKHGRKGSTRLGSEKESVGTKSVPAHIGKHEQQRRKGIHKRKREDGKHAIAETGEGFCMLNSGTSGGERFANPMQSKRCKAGSDALRMVSTQIMKRKAGTTTKDFSAAVDNSTTFEVTPLGKSAKISLQGRSKGTKFAGNLLKDVDESVPNGNGKTVKERLSPGTGGIATSKVISHVKDSESDPKERRPKAVLAPQCTVTAKSEGQLANSSTGMKQGLVEVDTEQVMDTDTRLSSDQAAKDFCASLESVHSVVEEQGMTVGKDIDNGVAGDEVCSGVTEGGEGNKEQTAVEKGDDSVGAEPGRLDVGWVLCDDCHKWRCIPAELADVIEATNCGWSCKDNPDKDFADCLIPQEKSNAEINAELNISEVSFCEEDDEKDPSVDSKSADGTQTQDRKQAVWTLIRHNKFQHRRRKTQTIDEIMVCQCKPPEDGVVGCGDECLNRMLSIECIPETCPCGDLCSNQQFQKRLYAKVDWFPCGKKGFGLQILEDVPKGTFIIEYVGEVLDMMAYEARQREYASRGQKHFYFMTLNSNEVIDACVKGNLGRFINHSCEPNCVTEKWMINGEVCIGLFAIRDLVKGEEITFDYNFVRVCGAAAKKCHCGSAECRGFIGGDPTTPLVVAESDSDEEDPLPRMLEEPHELMEAFADEPSQDKKPLNKHFFETAERARISGTKRKATAIDNNDKQGIVSKRVKTSSFSRKLRVTNAKGLTVETSGGRFEGVEETLNKVLDDRGGIGKRRDLVTHYLKLLVVTAASGDMIKGETSRSTRDLSMVLDALLKTKSYSVLIEIMDKNGLQILHNMIKQYRRDYKKTPIIRKLLKVLEFLATKQILTLEQINSMPSRMGIESLRDTIIELSRHNDTEVQEIARRFRFKWMPPLRVLQELGLFTFVASVERPQKNNHRFFSQYNRHQRTMFKDTEGRDRSYQSSSMDSEKGIKDQKQALPGVGAPNKLTDYDSEAKKRTRKKSRWDQPSKSVIVEGQPSDSSLTSTLANDASTLFCPDDTRNQFMPMNHSNQPGQAGNHHDMSPYYHERQPQAGGPASDHTGNCGGPQVVPGGLPGAPLSQNISQQFPPIPSSAQTPSSISQMPAVVSGIPIGTFMAQPLRGMMSQMPVCYGIPVALVQQFNGTQGTGPNVTPCSVQPLAQLGVGQNLSSNALPSEQQQQKLSCGQVLMTPHCWGPYLSGDWEENEHTRQVGSRRLEESIAEEAEVTFEPEPPVPGLSPPRKSTPVCQQLGGNQLMYTGDVNGGSSCQRFWKRDVSNRPQPSKYEGRKHHNIMPRRGYNYLPRQNHQTSKWHGPSNRSQAFHGAQTCNFSQNKEKDKTEWASLRKRDAAGFSQKEFDSVHASSTMVMNVTPRDDADVVGKLISSCEVGMASPEKQEIDRDPFCSVSELMEGAGPDNRVNTDVSSSEIVVSNPQKQETGGSFNCSIESSLLKPDGRDSSLILDAVEKTDGFCEDVSFEGRSDSLSCLDFREKGLRLYNHEYLEEEMQSYLSCNEEEAPKEDLAAQDETTASSQKID